jgi:hypothetical protein
MEQEEETNNDQVVRSRLLCERVAWGLMVSTRMFDRRKR